jgi:hypothetical protein
MSTVSFLQANDPAIAAAIALANLKPDTVWIVAVQGKEARARAAIERKL